jgi:hypothetical protein
MARTHSRSGEAPFRGAFPFKGAARRRKEVKGNICKVRTNGRHCVCTKNITFMLNKLLAKKI